MSYGNRTLPDSRESGDEARQAQAQHMRTHLIAQQGVMIN